jgi:hypothetical protein
MSLAPQYGPPALSNLAARYFLPQVQINPEKRVALVGTLPPRRCGIATFTADVQSSLNAVAGWQE